MNTVNKEEMAAFLRGIVGSENIADKDYALLSYCRDQGVLSRWGRMPSVVVKPKTVEEVQNIIRYANMTKTPVYPRGGGSSPFGYYPVMGGIVIDLTRMNRLISIDENSLTCVVEPGITFGELEALLAKRGFEYLVAPEGSLGGTVGGHVAYRGGSPFTFLVANQADCVTGLKVVLPTGEVVTTGAKAYPKAHGHYGRYSWMNDLTGLFLGAEGTLGVIVEIGLKIEELPEAEGNVTYSFNEIDSGAKALYKSRRARIPCHFCWYADGYTADLRDPAVKHPAVTIRWCKIAGTEKVVEDSVERLHKICHEEGGKDLGPEPSAHQWRDRYKEAATFLYALGSRMTFHSSIPIGEVGYYHKKAVELAKELWEKQGVKTSIGGHPMDRAFLMLMSLGCVEYDPEDYAKKRMTFDKIKNFWLDSGAVVYRAAIEYASDQMWRTGTYYELIKRIKGLIDPDHIMAPGYAGL